ncbi:hypothetical protein ACS0TY_035691 [Phlomoides rotata]
MTFFDSFILIFYGSYTFCPFSLVPYRETLLVAFVGFCSVVSQFSVHIEMASGSKGKNSITEDEEIIKLDDIGVPSGKSSRKKPFHAYGFLEAMKRAMNPTKGFTAKEIGPNLFSFHFQSQIDLREVLSCEPWHFERNIMALKQLDLGERPSSTVFSSMAMWVRLYDLPLSARS